MAVKSDTESYSVALSLTGKVKRERQALSMRVKAKYAYIRDHIKVENNIRECVDHGIEW